MISREKRVVKEKENGGTVIEREKKRRKWNGVKEKEKKKRAVKGEKENGRRVIDKKEVDCINGNYLCSLKRHWMYLDIGWFG